MEAGRRRGARGGSPTPWKRVGPAAASSRCTCCCPSAAAPHCCVCTLHCALLGEHSLLPNEPEQRCVTHVRCRAVLIAGSPTSLSGRRSSAGRLRSTTEEERSSLLQPDEPRAEDSEPALHSQPSSARAAGAPLRGAWGSGHADGRVSPSGPHTRPSRDGRASSRPSDGGEPASDSRKRAHFCRCAHAAGAAMPSKKLCAGMHAALATQLDGVGSVRLHQLCTYAQPQTMRPGQPADCLGAAGVLPPLAQPVRIPPRPSGNMRWESNMNLGAPTPQPLQRARAGRGWQALRLAATADSTHHCLLRWHVNIQNTAPAGTVAPCCAQCGHLARQAWLGAAQLQR